MGGEGIVGGIYRRRVPPARRTQLVPGNQLERGGLTTSLSGDTSVLLALREHWSPPRSAREHLRPH